MGDRDSFRNFLRMNTETFDELARLVYPALQKSQTRFPKPLSVEERLACTLRFLATGETYTSLQYQFRISKSAISIFVPEVCQVIYTVLKDKYLRCPPFLRPFFPRSFFGRLFVCSCPNNHCRLNRLILPCRYKVNFLFVSQFHCWLLRFCHHFWSDRIITRISVLSLRHYMN